MVAFLDTLLTEDVETGTHVLAVDPNDTTNSFVELLAAALVREKHHCRVAQIVNLQRSAMMVFNMTQPFSASQKLSCWC